MLAVVLFTLFLLATVLFTFAVSAFSSSTFATADSLFAKPPAKPLLSQLFLVELAG